MIDDARATLRVRPFASSGSDIPMKKVGHNKLRNSAIVILGVDCAQLPRACGRKSKYSHSLTSANRPMDSSASAKPAIAPRRCRRSARLPPARLPKPMPAMKAATITVTENRSAPEKSVRMRCQTTWYSSAAKPDSRNRTKEKLRSSRVRMGRAPRGRAAGG